VSVKDPCFSCQHRVDSIARVKRYRERNPEGGGMVCDPAPKYECKRHSGYGMKDETKIECRDYWPMEENDA
jgi:hypothetical protein